MLLRLRDTKKHKEISISVGNLNKISAASNINISADVISTDNFTLKLAGACKAKLSGETVIFNVKTAGASNLDAKDFLAENVAFKTAGACHAKISASKELHLMSAGAGNVKYYGNPSIKKKGAGAVKLLRM